MSSDVMNHPAARGRGQDGQSSFYASQSETRPSPWRPWRFLTTLPAMPACSLTAFIFTKIRHVQLTSVTNVNYTKSKMKLCTPRFCYCQPRNTKVTNMMLFFQYIVINNVILLYILNVPSIKDPDLSVKDCSIPQQRLLLFKHVIFLGWQRGWQ